MYESKVSKTQYTKWLQLIAKSENIKQHVHNEAILQLKTEHDQWNITIEKSLTDVHDIDSFITNVQHTQIQKMHSAKNITVANTQYIDETTTYYGTRIFCHKA